jgi:hypothetical protein
MFTRSAAQPSLFSLPPNNGHPLDGAVFSTIHKQCRRFSELGTKVFRWDTIMGR